MPEYLDPLKLNPHYAACPDRLKELEEALARNAGSFPRFFPNTPKEVSLESVMVQMAVHADDLD